MSNLVTIDSHALRILMTDDLYILPEQISIRSSEAENLTNIPAEKTAESSKLREFSYQGENNKYFLILFNDTQHKEMSMIHKETLLKIMSAKGLELRDLAIMNLNLFPGVSFRELKEFFSFSKIALFGIDPQRIALPKISLNLIEKQEGATVLCTFGLDEMINDTIKKRILECYEELLIWNWYSQAAMNIR